MIVGFIGTGNMGGAILKGYVRSSASDGVKILLHNRTTERNEEMAQNIEVIDRNIDIDVCNDNRELAEKAEIIIIGVKPDGVPEVLKEIAPDLNKAQTCLVPKNKIIISMAAGVSIAKMTEVLNEAVEGCGDKAKIVRVMPNTPAQVCSAMTSISRNENVSDEDFAKVKEIFDAVGLSEEVDEELIHCVIGVSGSSTAFTYMYIESLYKAAIENGMSPEKARVFAAKAVAGAAEMALRSSESLEQLRIDVCSPNGTTIEGVKALQNNGFEKNVKEAFQAAVNRSKEMTAGK